MRKIEAMSPTASSTADLFARTAVHSWKMSLDRLDAMFAAVSDADLQREIAPGRNRLFYLMGHLTVVHDRMLPLLGFGARRYEHLDQDFLINPDKAGPDRISAAALRAAWAGVNAALTAAIEARPAGDWLLRHEAISAEDFANEPLRNRLAVLLSRTQHVQFHAGQVRLVAPPR